MNKENVMPSSLTEAERAETMKLWETYIKIPDKNVRRVAMAYLEGMAAAFMDQAPKPTA